MVDYRTEEVIAEISKTSTSAKRLTLTGWNGQPAKLDLRIWRTDEEPAKPGKGITLTDEEARSLMEALNAHFRGI